MPVVPTKLPVHGTFTLRAWLGLPLAAWLGFAFSCQPALAADITDAYKLFRTGQYTQCAELAQQAIDDREFSESWRLIKIRADLARGDYELALETLDAALARYRSSIRLRWLGHEVCRYNGRDRRASELLDEIDELTDGASWRYRNSASRVTLGEFYLYRGVDPKRVLDGVFNQLKKSNPNATEPYIAAGRLALAKHDYALAAQQFEPALKLDVTNADIHYGLARAFAATDLAQAQKHLQAGLARNPHHTDSLLFIADSHIDAERYDDAEELLRRVLAVNVREPRAWAYLAVVAHLNNDRIGEQICRETALLWWQRNAEVHALIGRKLSQKYRFAEGAVYQRRALVMNPDYLPAKIQLSQDLLRLGHEDEGWRLAERVFEQDGYNVVAHNLVTLQDNLADFRPLTRDGFIVRMEPLEAAVYGARVLDLLVDAKRHLCQKYEIEINQPVLVEIFPRQEDFAIRTFGLPGGDGFLGVCFGNVITANSPASQGANPSNWQAVLWHEFCHVVTLNKTKNKMPRWLSEGISVYEEKQRNSTWGQSMTPQYRELILGDELVPVSQLSAAFLNPPSPMHLQFAYYESSLVVEYLIEEYGLETLQRILVDLSVGLTINESLLRYTGSLELLDAEFADFAKTRAEALAPELDWEKPELPSRVDAALLAGRLKEDPNNFWLLHRYGVQLVTEEKWRSSLAPLQRLRKLYPEYTEADSSYHLLAGVYRQLGETERERAVLDELAGRSADALDAYARLTELGEAAEDWVSVGKHAEQILAVNPLQPAPHRALARAAEKTGDEGRAVEALRVLALLNPLDPADVHFRLAHLLHKRGELPAARRHILQALEEAPRYRAAHRKLLEILREIKENEKRSS